MNLQEKLERMATTAFERRLLRRWLEASAADVPVQPEVAPEAANADDLESEPPPATA